MNHANDRNHCTNPMSKRWSKSSKIDESINQKICYILNSIVIDFCSILNRFWCRISKSQARWRVSCLLRTEYLFRHTYVVGFFSWKFFISKRHRRGFARKGRCEKEGGGTGGGGGREKKGGGTDGGGRKKESGGGREGASLRWLSRRYATH